MENFSKERVDEVAKKVKKYVALGVIVALGIIVLPLSVGTVGAGERGVALRFSAVTGEIKDEGLYFKIPFIERVVKMDVRIGKAEAQADAASADLQDVQTTIALNFHLDPTKVDQVYQEVKKDYGDRIISPAIQESVKAATALFTAEELITKRSEVREAIKKNLREKLEKRGILVDEFNIVNFSFSQSFDASIEKKVTAEQDALAAQNKLQQVVFEAQQRVEEAKGKAEAINIEARALRENPDILQLRAIEKWSGIMPLVTGGAVPFINIE